MAASGNSSERTEHRVVIPETELPDNYTAIVTGGHVGRCIYSTYQVL